jgi:hypothetical protein
MRSNATTVSEYLASLPADRRAGIEAVRAVILKNLDKDYEESMQWGMIGYAVPHRVWPMGYHVDPKKPLLMAALASQKNTMTVYLMSVFEGKEGNGGLGNKSEREWFQKAWKDAGKKLTMGGCCIHFKTLEDAALEVIGEAVRRTPAKKNLDAYLKMLARTGRGSDGKKIKGGTGEKAATGGKKVVKKVSKKVGKAAKKVSKKTAKR